MANLKKIIYLSEAQKNELFAQGSITSNNRTITYNENDIYVTPDKSIDSIQLNGVTYTSNNGTVNLGNVLTPTSGKVNSNIIAPVEATSTASQLYNENEVFIYNDQLYKATDTIPTSTTINPNINCDSINLIDYIKSICVTKNGTLTSGEQVTIQKMLGIYQAPWELIREDTVTNATEADIEITVDGNGQPLELTDVRLFLLSDSTNAQFVKGDYGRVNVWSGVQNYSLYIGAYTQAIGATSRGAMVCVEQKDGMITKEWTTNDSIGSNTSAKRIRTDANATVFTLSNLKTFDKITITAVTGKLKYSLFGKRKWT